MIAYIYRRKRRHNGKLTSARIWRARVKLNGEGRARDVSLDCSDKQTAEQKLRDMVRNHNQASVGLISPASQREAYAGLLKTLVVGYVADLKALGRSADHIRHVDKRLLRLMRECNWQSLGDVTAESFTRWRAEQKKTPKTLNEYRAALSAFFTWLLKQGRVAINPIEPIAKVDTRGKESFHRRALSDDEARPLLEGERRGLYLLVLHTGLRRGEINALRWSDLILDAANPYYLVPTASSKNRKEQPRPLHPELAAELRAMKLAHNGKPMDLVFPERVPPMKVIRADFAAAGIPLLDERGHRLDFHALRTTFITRMQREGVTPREAMELARHSDIRLTMKNYTDVAQLPLAATVRKMPAFGKKEWTHIGTQSLVAGSHLESPAVLGLKLIEVDKTIETIGYSHRESLVVAGSQKSENGGERGIRTPDTF